MRSRDSRKRRTRDGRPLRLAPRPHSGNLAQASLLFFLRQLG